MRSESLALLAVFAAACGGDGNDPATDGPPAGGDAGCAPPLVVFANRGGGTYTPGATDDAGTNQSRLVSETEVIAPYTGPIGWADLLACIRDDFAPFAIEIVDVDPGAAPHRELVLAADAVDLGFSPQVSGVAAHACPTAADPDPGQGTIAFAFADAWGTDGIGLCRDASRLIGHLFALEMVQGCDVMSFGAGCPVLTFRDEDLACGGAQPDGCACGGTTQNSYQRLLALAGPACP
jgi:hypothetical protein